MDEKAEDRHPKHDSTAQLITNLGKRNAQALKALENPLVLPRTAVLGQPAAFRAPSMLHPCVIFTFLLDKDLVILD